MISKKWLINLILTACVIFMGTSAYRVWTEDVRKPGPKASGGSEFSSDYKNAGQRKMPSESAYRVVADKNLFSPEREEFIPEETEPEAEVKQVKISGRKITLYGVILMADYKKALINNPVRKSDDPQSRWITVGDTVGNLTVAAIEKESVLFQDGSKKYEVLLYDRQKRRHSSPVSKQTAPQVISTESPKKRVTPLKKETKEETTAGNYEVIKTPFGDIKVRKK